MLVEWTQGTSCCKYDMCPASSYIITGRAKNIKKPLASCLRSGKSNCKRSVVVRMMLLVTATIAFGAILLAALYFRRLVSAFTGNLGQRLANPQSGTPGDKITLHSIYLPVHNCGGTRSPFTTKVEAYLRLAGLEYDTKPADLVSSPNGRVYRSFSCVTTPWTVWRLVPC